MVDTTKIYKLVKLLSNQIHTLQPYDVRRTQMKQRLNRQRVMGNPVDVLGGGNSSCEKEK